MKAKMVGCYVMDGVTYTKYDDGGETSRKATPEEVMLSHSLVLAVAEQAIDKASRNAGSPQPGGGK